jgi:hypothetical protein
VLDGMLPWNMTRFWLPMLLRMTCLRLSPSMSFFLFFLLSSYSPITSLLNTRHFSSVFLNWQLFIEKISQHYFLVGQI